MGLAREHRPVKLIVGMFTAREELLGVVRAELCESYGAVDLPSPSRALEPPLGFVLSSNQARRR